MSRFDTFNDRGVRTGILAWAAGGLALGLLATGAWAWGGGGEQAAELDRHEYKRVVMGVQARILVWAADGEHARDAARDAFARMAELDLALSDWRLDSEILSLTAAAGAEPVPVSDDLFEALALADRLHALSGGAFDASVGPLVRLWRSARMTGQWPDAEARDVARARCGWEGVELGAEARTVRLARSGMQLDLGAIGKGEAASAALAVLARAGLPRALVEVGGDLALGDAPPDAAGWVVSAGCDNASPHRMTLANAAVATSGEYLSPALGSEATAVLDPRVPGGLVERGGHRCYTVVCESGSAGALADGLATVANLLGHRAGRVAVEEAGAQLLVHDPRATSLFDGATLAGWTPRGGRYDGDARWSVEDDVLTGRTGEGGEGGLLYTEREYAAFELELETWIDHPFDSGVFLRMVPRAAAQEGGPAHRWADRKGPQVTLDWRPDGEIGGIYADGWWQHAPEGAALFRTDAWNHVELRCTGFDPRVQVWINGHLVTDWTTPPENAREFAPAGRIGVQVHPADADSTRRARFRNVRVRELPLFADAGDTGDWEPLFDGETLEGWELVGDPEGYRVVDGAWEFPAAGGSGHVRTREDFRDFRLQLDFKPERMANSGVYLRSARTDANPSYSGCEVQILDDFHWEEVTGSTLGATQFTGSLYGAVPPGDRGALHALGEWNQYEILYEGSRLAVALNGRVLYDVDTFALATEPPFAERVPQGFLGMQRYVTPDVEGDTAVAFRGVRVQRLSE